MYRMKLFNVWRGLAAFFLFHLVTTHLAGQRQRIPHGDVSRKVDILAIRLALPKKMREMHIHPLRDENANDYIPPKTRLNIGSSDANSFPRSDIICVGIRSILHSRCVSERSTSV